MNAIKPMTTLEKDLAILERNRTWDFGENGSSYGFSYVAFDNLEPVITEDGRIDETATSAKYWAAAEDFFDTATRADKTRILAAFGDAASEGDGLTEIAFGTVGAILDIVEIPHKLAISTVYALAATFHEL